MFSGYAADAGGGGGYGATRDELVLVALRTLGATLGKESPALPLASRLLVLDPGRRPKAVDALSDDYFARDPPPELRPVVS